MSNLKKARIHAILEDSDDVEDVDVYTSGDAVILNNGKTLEYIYTNEVGDTSKLNTTNKDLVNAVNENTAQLSDVAKKTKWVCPEMFGCIGDGITDDTVNLQSAIDYAIANNLRLESSESQIYLISSTLSITDAIKMNLNYATIKAVSAVSKMIDINTDSDFLHIKNIILDMNSLAGEGLHVTYGRRGIVECIEYLNNTGIGFNVVSGYELRFSEMTIKGKTTAGMGFKVTTNDCHFTKIFGVDNYIGWYTEGTSIFTEIHLWIWDTTLLEGSIWCKLNGSPIISKSSPDSYQYAFYVIGTLHRPVITELYPSYNILVYKAPNVSTNPYLFYFDTDSENSAKYFSLTNSYLTTVNYDTTGITGSGQFSNIDKTKFMGYIDNNTYFGYSDDINIIKSSVTLASGFTQIGTRNVITKKNKRVILELYCKTTSALTSSDTTVGTFPYYLGHAVAKYFAVGMGISGYEIDGIGYGYIDGTTLKIKSSTADTGKFYYYMINVEYDTQ
jgi:hypothetical protein